MSLVIQHSEHQHRGARLGAVVGLALAGAGCGDLQDWQRPSAMQQNAGAAVTPAQHCAQPMEEALPQPSASVSDLRFDGDVAAFVDATLERRYPFGLSLIEGAREQAPDPDCSVRFAGEPSSASEVYEVLDFIVHECAHVYDLFSSSGSANLYVINSELRFECDLGDTTERNGETFARSRIVRDELQPFLPPCSPSDGGACDRYASTYLDGDPDDTLFQGGDQGYNMLLEEAVQYINSLATTWAFVEERPERTSVSARDGALTFLWYVERYLRLARTEYPVAYERIAGDACWRDATLAVWDRAWKYLELTATVRGLGINDDALQTLVLQPELVEEIVRLRPTEACAME